MRGLLLLLALLAIPDLIDDAVADERKPGATFRDCADCPLMVMIPGGEYRMGAEPEEEHRESLAAEFRNRSLPQRRVHIRSFAAGKYEITRAQYRQFAEETGRGSASCFAWIDGEYRLEAARSWRNPGFAQDDTHPATCISWEDAAAYVQWLGRRTGKPYRLLTEAEWEYAARAGTTTIRYWGDDGDASCAHANGADRSTLSQVAAARDWHTLPCDDGHAHTAPVGRYGANAFGLHDMLGNVAEWTADCWNADYRGAPGDGSARLSGDCDLRVVRGGAWDEGAAGLRAAYRVGSPVVVRVYARGFRVARSLEGQ